MREPQRGDLINITFNFGAGTAQWRLCTGNRITTRNCACSSDHYKAKYLGSWGKEDGKPLVRGRVYTIHLGDSCWEYAEDRFVTFVREVLASK